MKRAELGAGDDHDASIHDELHGHPGERGGNVYFK